VVLDTQATYKRDKVALKQKRASYKRARVACMIWAYPKIDELEIPQQAKKSLFYDLCGQLYAKDTRRYLWNTAMIVHLWQNLPNCGDFPGHLDIAPATLLFLFKTCLEEDKLVGTIVIAGEDVKKALANTWARLKGPPELKKADMQGIFHEVFLVSCLAFTL
jgi:hypothetical protein